MLRFILAWALGWPVVGLAAESQKIPTITNLKELAAPLKLSRFKGEKFKRKLRIAILDNGFNGHDSQIGVSLPRETFYEKYEKTVPKRKADEMNLGTSYHGTLMAQTLAGIIRESGVHADYELYLFLTYGYTKFADAVDELSNGGFDLILYSQVWEYGGNGDGKGFINALVQKALATNAVWVNAAGNFGRSTRINKVDGKLEGQHEYVVFDGGNAKGVTITCTPPKGSTTCPLRLTLAWNDFKDDTDTGTDKDLDLYLEKGDQREAAGVKIQTTQKEDSKRYSLFPRELIEKDISAGTYLARVRILSKNFSTSQDWLRITSSGLGIKMKDPSIGETILPPADLEGVVVVGANDDLESGQSKKLNRPDLLLKSSVRLSDGTNPRSSSLAAAIAAGALAVHLGTLEEKNAETVAGAVKELKGKGSKVAKNLKEEKETTEKREVSTTTRPKLRTKSKQGPRVVSSTTSGGSCLSRTRLPNASGELGRILADKGSEAVIFRGRPAILVTYNFARQMGVRLKSGQRIYAGPDSLAIAEAYETEPPGSGFFEVIQTSWGYRACK